MKAGWSVESLCLVIAGLVTSMAAVLAFGLLEPDSASRTLLLAMLTAGSLIVLFTALRIRILSTHSSQRYDRSRALQRRYKHFVDTAHEGIWMVDRQGCGVFANQRLAEMFGCSVEELLRRPLDDFLGDNPRESLEQLLADHDSYAGRTFDLIYRRVDGSVGWAIASGRPASAEEDMVGGALLLLTDITVRKKAELELAAVQIGLEVRIRKRTAELQDSNQQLRIEVRERELAEQALSDSYAALRRLTAHLETIKEQERKRIALDIHDDLGQNLMALKIDLQMLHARCAALPGLQDEVGRTLQTVDASIRATRTIINELHPSTLELGLAAAAEWLLDQFEKRSGIACSLSVRGADEHGPDERRAAVIYRIIEESLVGIEHHACATQVEVTMAFEPHDVTVTILDDGRGLHPGNADQGARFILNGMRERVDVFGGELQVTPRARVGTCLMFRIPRGSGQDGDQASRRYNSKVLTAG